MSSILAMMQRSKNVTMMVPINITPKSTRLGSSSDIQQVKPDAARVLDFGRWVKSTRPNTAFPKTACLLS